MRDSISTLAVLFLFLFLIVITLFCSKDPISPEPENYGVPQQLDDGWEIASLFSQGLDSIKIANLASEIRSGNHKKVHSLLIVRNGYLIFEDYYYGNGVDKAHEIRSASKSYMSTLVGIALNNGFIHSLDQKMMDFFPEYQTPNLDSTKYQITIKHLLQMRSGLTDDDSYTESENWIKYITELPLGTNPGEQWYYATSGTHLLSGIITKATGKSCLDFAEEYLFEPLNISIDNWTQDPQSYYSGGNHMVFTSRDMVRFGLLYLNNGKFNGKQIISSQWITETLQPYSNTGWGWGSDFEEGGYGYLWYIGKMNQYQVYFAAGHGGQFILNVPKLNMVIVTTAEWWLMDGPAWIQMQTILSFISNNILTAVVYE